MNGNTQFQASQDRMVRPEPFRAKYQSRGERAKINRQKVAESPAAVKVDDPASKRLNVGPDRTEDEHRLPIVHEAPRGSQAKFAQILREWRCPLTDRRNRRRQVARHEWALFTDAQIEARVLAVPNDFTIAKSRGPPVVLDQATCLVTAQPTGKIFKLIAIGQDRGYLIPDTSGPRWIPTDPKRHVEIWSEANKAHNGDLVPLLKMLKGWNASRSLLKSFHLETLALNILTNFTISSFPSGVRFFFDKARATIRTKLADPAGYSDDVAQHINTTEQMDAIVKRLDWALARAQEAEKFAAAGKTADAFARWSQLIPNHFPAYG